MKFTKIPVETFKNITLNAGIVLSKFDTETATADAKDILGATSGGITFSAKSTYKDFGEDIDNCPKNTMELKKLETWEATMSGDFATITPELAKKLIGAADLNGIEIKPRNDLKLTDFFDLWLVADYSSVNDGAEPGFAAIHLKNALSTGGFEMKTADKEKGKFSFEFTGHYSLEKQDEVPFDVYIKEGKENV